MDLQITGRVTQILDEQSGEGRNGPWRKREFILETEGNYPKSVCVVMWGDDIDKFAVEEGERLTAHIDIQSREFKGRWYTDVKAWRIEREEAGTADAGGPDEGPGARRGGRGDSGSRGRGGPGGRGGRGGRRDPDGGAGAGDAGSGRDLDDPDSFGEDDDLPF